MDHPDRDLLALGIRQPWVELILRGAKTIEVRTLEVSHRGRIYLYAARQLAEGAPVQTAVRGYGLDMAALPRGVIVGTVELVDCRPCRPEDALHALQPPELLRGKRAWVLGDPLRLQQPLRPRFRPYGIWFYPFQRRTGGAGLS